MKKRLIIALCVVTSIMMFSGCGKKFEYDEDGQIMNAADEYATEKIEDRLFDFEKK